MAVLGRKSHPTSQPVFCRQAWAFSSCQRREASSAAQAALSAANKKPAHKIRLMLRFLMDSRIAHSFQKIQTHLLRQCPEEPLISDATKLDEARRKCPRNRTERGLSSPQRSWNVLRPRETL